MLQGLKFDLYEDNKLQITAYSYFWLKMTVIAFYSWKWEVIFKNNVNSCINYANYAH